MCGIISIVTHPDSSSAATSPCPAASSSVLKPCVHDPTEQLPWSSATVENVRSPLRIQNTQPAGTRPRRPSADGSDIGASNAGTPAGRSAVKVIAIGGALGCSAAVSSAASVDQSAVVVMAALLLLLRRLVVRVGARRV